MITKERKQFLKTLDEELDYHLKTSPDEIKVVLNNGIYNSIPQNIAKIVDDIMAKFPSADLTVGNEGSRVLYVTLYSGDADLKAYVSFMETLAAKYEADEFNIQSSLSLKYRFWWD